MKKILSNKDKLAILEDKYNSLPEDSYKKKQMWGKLQEAKRKYDPKVVWQGGTYHKKLHQGAQEAFERRRAQANEPAPTLPEEE